MTIHGSSQLKIFFNFGALKFFSHENVMFHLIPNDVLRDTRKMEWHIDRGAVAAAGCGVICIAGGRNVPQLSETSDVSPSRALFAGAASASAARTSASAHATAALSTATILAVSTLNACVSCLGITNTAFAARFREEERSAPRARRPWGTHH